MTLHLGKAHFALGLFVMKGFSLKLGEQRNTFWSVADNSVYFKLDISEAFDKVHRDLLHVRLFQLRAEAMNILGEICTLRKAREQQPMRKNRNFWWGRLPLHNVL